MVLDSSVLGTEPLSAAIKRLLLDRIGKGELVPGEGPSAQRAKDVLSSRSQRAGGLQRSFR